MGEAIRLFGFKRSGTNIVNRFRRVLHELVKRGTMLREGSLLRAPEDGGVLDGSIEAEARVVDQNVDPSLGVHFVDSAAVQ